MSSVIEARSLVKRYRQTKAVDGVSFEVARGEIFGLLGPNGAGKTTTILMLLGLTEVSGGEVKVLGLDPAREPLEVKARVGYLPDSVGFYEYMSGAENLAYTGRLMGIDRAEREKRIRDALERTGLSNVANSPVSTYSHGMRQRLGIAEILMKGAEIAILDEPTSGLDPHATHELLDLIRTLKSDKVTVLLSSHLLDQVQRVCDRVALFQGGKIALIGSVPELARQVLGSGYAVEVEAEGDGLLERLRAVPGVSQVTITGLNRFRLLADRDVRPEAAEAVVNARGKLRRLSVDEPSLDAIYTAFFNQQNRTREVRHAA